MEDEPPLAVMGVAYFHDIGIHEAVRKHGSNSGHYHSPREEGTLNFQVLHEADWLVNIEEEGISKEQKRLETLIGKVFRRVTGKWLAEKLYFN